MTDPAKDPDDSGLMPGCDPCQILGYPCRSHDRPTDRHPDQQALADSRPPACGKTGCTNPTLHSHKASERDAVCGLTTCTTPMPHTHRPSEPDREPRTFEVGPSDPAPEEVEPGDLIVRADWPQSYPPGWPPPPSPLTGVHSPQEFVARPEGGRQRAAAAAAAATPDCGMPGCTIGGEPHVHFPSIEPDLSTTDPFRPGSWVKVWAQVGATQERVHPDDIALTVWTHNSDERWTVKRTYVQPSDDTPTGAWQCTHLSTYAMDPTMIVRCQSYEGKGHEHYWEHQRWSDKQTVGYIEER